MVEKVSASLIKLLQRLIVGWRYVDKVWTTVQGVECQRLCELPTFTELFLSLL